LAERSLKANTRGCRPGRQNCEGAVGTNGWPTRGLDSMEETGTIKERNDGKKLPKERGCAVGDVFKSKQDSDKMVGATKKDDPEH